MLSDLSPFLDTLYQEYHHRRWLASDPLDFVHRFKDPRDQESVALYASLLAYGNVKQIRRSLDLVLKLMLTRFSCPSHWVLSLLEDVMLKQARQDFHQFRHRFNSGDDLVLLGRLLAESWQNHKSLGHLFLNFHGPNEETIENALNGFIRFWKKRAVELVQIPRGPGFQHLLTSPEDGSVCKRWCMFLRWMGRKDELDIGLWSQAVLGEAGLQTQQLIIPLDTHVGRISQYLGLTRRKSLNWQAALEVTKALQTCNFNDPVRYDFALARLGILQLCRKHYEQKICQCCQLLPGCRYAKRKAKRTRRSRET